MGHCEKKVLIDMRLILDGHRDTAVCINPTTLDFYLWGCMDSEAYKRKVDTRDELLARILDAAACIKKHEDQLRRTTRDLRPRATK